MQIRYHYYKELTYHHTAERNPDGRLFHLHTHADAEIYCFLSGHGIFHVEGSAYDMRPGDIVIMRPDESHYIEIFDDRPYERLVLNFPFSMLDSLEDKERLLRPFKDRPVGTKNLYAGGHFPIDAIAVFTPLIDRENKDGYLLPFMTTLLEGICTIFESGYETSRKTYETVEAEIMREITEDFTAKPSIQQLAKKYYISTVQLERRFKKATGTTVAEYANTKRMVFARQQIENGVKPTALYEKCGFADYSAFYRAYKKYYGCSPKTKIGKSL